MLIVGVGCAPDLITMQAAEIIWNAKRVAGSEQALTLAEEYIQETSFVYVLKDYFKLEEFPSDTVILTTGDPMLAGLHAEGADYVPGISSMQVALARLHVPLHTVSVVLAHGKDHTSRSIDDAVEEVGRGRNVFVATDPKFDVKALADALLSKDLECKMVVCQDLGYEEERFIHGTSRSPPEPTSDLFAVMLGHW
jgi:cobalt-precorrin-7 (C5)-methyltransferase